MGLLLALARQCGIEGEAVEMVVGHLLVAVALLVVLNARNVAEGGHQVVEGQLMVVDRARGHLGRPAHDEGNADAAFVGAALDSLEQAVAVEERGVGSALFVRSVVRGEDEHGIVGQSFLLEFSHNLAHLYVEARYHGRKFGVAILRRVIARTLVPAIGALLAEMSLVGQEDGVLGLGQFGVRQGIGEDSEERLVGRLLVQPGHGALVNQVGGVLLALLVVRAIHGVGRILLQHFALHAVVARAAAVTIQEVGIVEVGLELADVAIELVDAALVGRRVRAFVAARPFAKHTRGVAVVLENFGDNHVVGVVGLLAHAGVVRVCAVLHRACPILLVGAHMGVARVLSCHEAGARRSRNGAARIGLREAHALVGQAVNVGSGYQTLAIATEVTITHVVTHYIYNIGALLCTSGKGGKGGTAEEKCMFHSREDISLFDVFLSILNEYAMFGLCGQPTAAQVVDGASRGCAGRSGEGNAYGYVRIDGEDGHEGAVACHGNGPFSLR